MKYRFGFVQEYEGRMALVDEVIEKEAMEAAAYVHQALKTSITEILEMNIYEFCRLHQQARKTQAEEAERLARLEKKKR